VADDEVPDDLFAAVEEVFGTEDPVLEVTLEAFMAQPAPQADRLRGLIVEETHTDHFGSSKDERTPFYDQADDQAGEVRLRSSLRWLGLVGLLISLGGLYTLWMLDLGGGEKFSFTLANSWPAIAFGSLLLGLCLEQLVGWCLYKCFKLRLYWYDNSLFSRWKNWRDAPRRQHSHCHCWRCQRFSRTHWNVCKCLRCKFKRRWPYWRRLRRYRYR